MRELELNEEEFKAFKEYISMTKRSYYEVWTNDQVSTTNYNRMNKVLTKIERLNRVRVRYDKTKTEKYWIEELKKICREIKK